MATINPFDLLGDDTEDPSLLAAQQPKKTVAPSAKQPSQTKAAAQLPSKPAPPAQAVREAKSKAARGGCGAGGGPNREYTSNEIHTAIGNSLLLRVDPTRVMESLYERRAGYGGSRGSFHGGRRGGFSIGEAGEEVDYPHRTFERRSGTGRGCKLDGKALPLASGICWSGISKGSWWPERKVMADQIEQMGVAIENHKKQIEELESKYESQIKQCTDLSKKLDATQKDLNQTSKLLANTKEELKQCQCCLKERDFIISELKRSENALAHQACVLRADLEKSQKDNASLFLKIAREDKLNSDNRSNVLIFQIGNRGVFL